VNNKELEILIPKLRLRISGHIERFKAAWKKQMPEIELVEAAYPFSEYCENLGRRPDGYLNFHLSEEGAKYTIAKSIPRLVEYHEEDMPKGAIRALVSPDPVEFLPAYEPGRKRFIFNSPFIFWVLPHEAWKEQYEKKYPGLLDYNEKRHQAYLNRTWSDKLLEFMGLR
jgi:hypothetical protein